jgi:CRISPR-associated protein Cas1
VEGRGTAVYFSVFRHLITRPGWTFEKRVRRPPGDPGNVLLSLAYPVLAQNVESAVRTVGLDPYLGFLHQVEYNRPSLALDLMEPFRPIIADSVVLRCINNGILLPEHFAADPEGPYPVRLLDEGRSRFIRELEARLNLEFTDPESGERITYRRLLERQARQLARCLQSGERFRPFRVR